MINGDVDHKMATATRPVVEIPFATYVAKRKRSESESSSKMTLDDIHQEAKRFRGTEDFLLEPIQVEESPTMENTDSVVGSRRVWETIESQFSLEILLKHDELRLINQELAKCQAAMEQLRRCHLIPYPSALETSDSMANVSNGTGQALRQGNSVPQWATPYGVTDGPYSRHYSKWLIPDYNFDGVRDDWHPYPDGSRAGKSMLEGRSTRNSIGDLGSASTKSRNQRGSNGQKLQALPHGYPQPKEKAGPCVLKRGDGQIVKLVCIDCQRENFSSTQGFINHCRIAHRREFKSHEEAAITSGQPIEFDETGGIVGEEKIPTENGLVHPLIRSAPTDPAAYRALLSRIDTSLALYEQGKLPGITKIPTSAKSTPLKTDHVNQSFVPSPDTPYLSKFMRSRGFGGNLTDMISEAKTPVDFEDLSSQDDESDDGGSQPRVIPGGFGLDGSNDSPRPMMRMPARAAKLPGSFGRPNSSKGIKPGISPRMSYATPTLNTTANYVKPPPLLVSSDREDFDNRHEVDVDIDVVGPLFVDLSPNNVASNNAPSLVSDDGEYDEGDDAESVSSEPEEEGSDVAEIEFIDGEVKEVVPRTVLRNRSGSGDNMRMKQEDKHVTFVSPVKERDSRAKQERRARN